MIKIKLICAACGRESSEFSAFRQGEKPHYDLDSDVKRFCKKIKWVYQDNICGDIYCSKECAK